MRILILGASGQLGHCLVKVAGERKVEGLILPDEKDANILDREQIGLLLEKERPDYVINCAAYTAVDKAEDEVGVCRKVNAEGAGIVAEACAASGATLIHISTDFVFEGMKTGVLSEEEDAKPVSIYGLTKLEGEQAVKQHLEAHFMLRTSWLYSEYGNNFVKTMQRLGRERDELGVIVDQVGTPTYAIDLAGAIFDIILSGTRAYGLYHYSNEGVTSWYDFAKAIFDLSQIEVRLKPLKTSEYPTKARRPAYSVMDKSKIRDTLSIQIPYWRDSLKVCIERLEA